MSASEANKPSSYEPAGQLNVRQKLAKLRQELAKDERDAVDRYRNEMSTSQPSDDVEVISDEDLPLPIPSHGQDRGDNRRRRPRSYEHKTSRRSRSPKRSRTPRRRSSERRDRQRGDREPYRSRKHRSRSPSPYAKALEQWERFKQSEQVMLNAQKRKQDIYDRRPEDHPDYPEEWREFWEKRHNELQLQGKDADNYDYKTEWIPHWSKRVAAIYEEEVKAKTQDLLKRHQLESAEKPRRDDYRRKAPSSPAKEGEHSRRSRHRRSSQSPSSKRHRSPGGSDPYRRPSTRHSPSWRREPSPGNEAGTVQLTQSLRLLLALEETLGSLGSQVQAIMTRAIALDKQREGCSNILIENADVMCILEMVREKLSGQLGAGILSEMKEGAARIAKDHLDSVLRAGTRKRPLEPPNIAASSADRQQKEKARLKYILATEMAKALLDKGMDGISDCDLQVLLYKVVENTELDDGTMALPPVSNPGYQVPDQREASSYYKDNTESNQAEASYSKGNYSSPNFAYGGAQTRDLDTHPSTGANPSAPEVVVLNDSVDDFDDLTLDELRSLLDNFKNLSKLEQMDLIQYMRKLETNNPSKVQLLKQKKSVSHEGSGAASGRPPQSPLQQRSFSSNPEAPDAQPTSGDSEQLAS